MKHFKFLLVIVALLALLVPMATTAQGPAHSDPVWPVGEPGTATGSATADTAASTTVFLTTGLNRYVDAATGVDSGDCTVTPCATISYAINQSVDGDKIKVAAGTYTEQLIIDHSLKIMGDPGATIMAPTGRQTFHIPESSKVYDPIIFAYGGINDGSNNISGDGVIAVDLTGFTIDGQNDFQAGSRYLGVFFRGVSGTIGHNVVQNIGIDGTETFGITVYGNSDVSIEHNTVTGYSRGGISLNGDLDADYHLTDIPVDPSGQIVHNYVEGPGKDEDVTWAPNGIQVGYGASGLVAHNEVVGNGWPGAEWSGSAIIIVDTANVMVEKNTVHNNESGIVVVGFWNSGADVTVSRNDVFDNDWNMQVVNDYANTVFEYNNVQNGFDGIDIWKYSWGPEYPSNTIAYCNNISDHVYDGMWTNLPEDYEPVNAEENWWGDPSGPSGDGPGTGDSATGNLDFDPWLEEPCSPPTAITLASFMADATADNIVLSWETGTEVDNAGFNLYRATSADGPWQKINGALIDANGDAAAGASYSFADAPGAGVFYYQLEDVDYSGITTMHGPVLARLGPATRSPWFRPVSPIQ